MAGFEVDPAVLRGAADVAAQAAGVVRGLGLERVAELADALPGAESGGTARTLGPRWAGSADVWAGAVDSYATGLVAAADDYEGQDAEARLAVERSGER
ncbi:hypothetical protein [Actinosynnema mirum]|uniref:Excreted virulence factor EspC, type VII ESX diderm n=1 Tax=Actinosynnema mirum (strain ATCC 29888 / DSM 43827 / JCM 3225 / NBRC 14064 / NCIMB 13271 / NRRL B-12336 / IMRU 3971 / 101) TaxID=446462 RepID=C6WP66_ACTMD|nr:hypothetical protein [Actinosynnema mirum]ACU38568.1 hypothetical protein Amir_4739 [Actinosynnema mirum DSM 43827]